MTEVLGQRSLLGFGVVLAWLVLFHLLVNIWLLCVFTSLLVVLGGWLGSQAVLESNSVVHLERFITLEQVSSCFWAKPVHMPEFQCSFTQLRLFCLCWTSASNHCGG